MTEDMAVPEPYVNDTLTLWDEAEIEAQIIDLSKEGLVKNRQLLTVFRCALRTIDALKLSGLYGQKVAKLRRKISNPPNEYSSDAARDFVRAVGNLMQGLRSSDPEQKMRFQKMAKELNLLDMIPGDLPRALLDVLEPAKKPRGRKSLIVPWFNEQSHMETMRVAVAAGQTVLAAARVCANDADKRSVIADERAKTLAKLFRQKMALRE